jgi:ppGpp synthetase/RelA/SpoT-type nucleotidyltranferase
MKKIDEINSRLVSVEMWMRSNHNLNYLKREDVCNFIREETRYLKERLETQSEQINTLLKMLEMYKQVLDTSGIISRCEADRTEFQWDEARKDYLGRNFHFKVNKVITE